MKTLYTFKLLSGVHVQFGSTYHVGETFESFRNLAEIHNVPGNPPKFQLISTREATPTPVAPKPAENDNGGGEGEKGKSLIDLSGLDGMNLEQLKAFAAENEVDITGLSTKKEIASKIREVLA